MSLNVLKLYNQYKTKTTLLIITRFTHQNHPGHKHRKRVIEPKNELPDEYTDEPIYPPVKPKYPPGLWSEDYDASVAWNYYAEGKKFNSLKTVQERLAVMAYLNIQPTVDDLGVTRIRRYPLYLLSTLPAGAESTKQRQYITKTHLEAVPYDKLPGQDATSISPQLYDNLKSAVVNCILSNRYRNDKSEDLMKNFQDKGVYVADSVKFEENLNSSKERNSLLVNDVFDTLSSALASASDSFAHLKEAQYGRNVSIEAYWKRCGYKDIKARGCVWPDVDSIRYQFRDKALYQIKTNMPLKAPLGLDEINYEEKTIPEYNYNPVVYKIFADHTLPQQVPGHWFGDSREFNYLTVHDLTNLAITEDRYGKDEVNSALESMAITSAHAELTAQAYYLGFSMWNDLTYPLYGQFIYTDGERFSLATYQLNTIQLWNDGVKKKNFCHVTKLESLFELSEDGRSVARFNDELFKKILNFLQQQPVREASQVVKSYLEFDYMLGGTALRPYLSVQDFKNQLSKRRQLLATSLYELCKYDRPATYLNIHNDFIPKGEKPRFADRYNRITYTFRDIVRDYYPRDYYGYELVKMMLKTSQAYRPKYWDLLDPVYEWASIPPPHTNNIKRDINLATF